MQDIPGPGSHRGHRGQVGHNALSVAGREGAPLAEGSPPFQEEVLRERFVSKVPPVLLAQRLVFGGEGVRGEGVGALFTAQP